MYPLAIQVRKQSMADELERRRCEATVFGYAQQRGGSEALYGTIGAINVRDALGLTLGTVQRAQRRQPAFWPGAAPMAVLTAYPAPATPCTWW